MCTASCSCLSIPKPSLGLPIHFQRVLKCPFSRFIRPHPNLHCHHALPGCGNSLLTVSMLPVLPSILGLLPFPAEEAGSSLRAPGPGAGAMAQLLRAFRRRTQGLCKCYSSEGKGVLVVRSQGKSHAQQTSCKRFMGEKHRRVAVAALARARGSKN